MKGMPTDSGNGGFHELRFLTAEEVAEMFRVSKATIYRWAEQGVLPSLRMGRTVRFNEGEIRAALAHGLDQKTGS